MISRYEVPACHFFLSDDMNISSSDSIHMQSLSTYTVVAGKTHEPGNAERLPGRNDEFLRAVFFLCASFVCGCETGRTNQNRSHPANNLGHDSNRSAAAVFASAVGRFLFTLCGRA
jgi:hypothetical protein